MTDLTDPAAIEEGVATQANEVWKWCWKERAFGRTVTVKIKYADFRQATRSRTLALAVADQALLRQTAVELVRLVFPPEQGIRLLGVTVSGFDSPAMPEADRTQLALAL